MEEMTYERCVIKMALPKYSEAFANLEASGLRLNVFEGERVAFVLVPTVVTGTFIEHLPGDVVVGIGETFRTVQDELVDSEIQMRSIPGDMRGYIPVAETIASCFATATAVCDGTTELASLVLKSLPSRTQQKVLNGADEKSVCSVLMTMARTRCTFSEVEAVFGEYKIGTEFEGDLADEYLACHQLLADQDVQLHEWLWRPINVKQRESVEKLRRVLFHQARRYGLTTFTMTQLDIADKASMFPRHVKDAADQLVEVGLLTYQTDQGKPYTTWKLKTDTGYRSTVVPEQVHEQVQNVVQTPVQNEVQYGCSKISLDILEIEDQKASEKSYTEKNRLDIFFSEIEIFMGIESGWSSIPSEVEDPFFSKLFSEELNFGSALIFSFLNGFEGEGFTFSEIMNELELPKSSYSQNLKGLVDLGLVSKNGNSYSAIKRSRSELDLMVTSSPIREESPKARSLRERRERSRR